MDNQIMMDVDQMNGYEAQYEFLYHPVLTHTISQIPFTYQNQLPQTYPQAQYENNIPQPTSASFTNQPQSAITTKPTANEPQPLTNTSQPTTSQPEPMTSTQPNTDSQTHTNIPQTTDKPKKRSKTKTKVKHVVSKFPLPMILPPDESQEDIKPDIKVLEANLKKATNRGKQKPKGRTSSYWNKKITDKDFQFYGCSICNISFKDLDLLDKHMVQHKNRLTTYEFRMISVKTKKKLKKEKKKKKKEAKIKKEAEEMKPENGYIGSDKVVDEKGEIKNSDNDSKETSENSKKSKPKTVEEYNKNSPAYRRHLNEQQYIHAYKCFGCDKLFTLSYYLKIHVRSHTGEKPYPCKLCNQNFITASKMNRHVKRIHYATRHQCRICFRIFTRFELLVKHFDAKHPEDKLEGEPYDYNAILPYLQELEDQMKDEKSKDGIKKEEPWEAPAAPLVAGLDKMDGNVQNTSSPIKEEKISLNIEFIDNKYPELDSSDNLACTVEEIKVDVPVKEEQNDDDCANNDDVYQEDSNDDVFKTEDQDSEDDYLPIKTWAKTKAPPKQSKKSVRKWEQPTNCPVCNKYISKTKNLAVHMYTHTGEKKFQCSECDRRYSTAAALRRHRIDAHHNKSQKDSESKENEPKIEADNGDTKVKEAPQSDEEFLPSAAWAEPPAGAESEPRDKRTCPICNKQLSSKTYLTVHMRMHTGEKPFSCYLCGRGFITASKMHRHALTHHEAWEDKDIKSEEDVKPKKVDDEDDKESILLEKAKSYMAAKKSKKEFFNAKREKHSTWTLTCEFCNKRFLHKVTLQVHRKTHKADEKMKCYYCLEQFASTEQLSQHRHSHVAPNLYQCQFCRRDFPKKTTMVSHRKRCETRSGTDDKSYICDICNKRFKCSTKLQRHLAAHSGARYSLRFECPVCAHMFHTKYHIHMHLRSHIKEGLIQEENRSAVLAMVLQNARRIPKPNVPPPEVPDQQNADERSRICNICGEMFTHFYFLEQHLQAHADTIRLDDLDREDDKKHTCTVCSKSFKLPYYLKLHSFTHTKEKPFICQECGKGFITRGKLKRHLETHQGLKKFQCHICYKFFTRVSYLRIHIRTIHGPQDYGLGLPIGVCQSLPLAS